MKDSSLKESVQIQVSALFDLHDCPHKALFDVKVVWEVLDQLHGYLLKWGSKMEGELEDGVVLRNPHTISIGKGTRVESGAYICGPCVIGKNCEIRHGAYLRGDVLACDECVIGHSTEVKNSIFLRGACAGHFAYVGDSILGNHVNLGAGTKCANLRLDRANIKIGKEDSGRHKLGAILGDSVQTGCNAVTNPGTIMAKGSWCLPCAVVKGYVHG